MKALQLALTVPWAIQPEMLQTVLEIAARENLDPEAVATRLGRPLDNSRSVTIHDNGVACIPITGPIMRRGNWFSEISGATSTRMLALDLQRAAEDPAVKAILLVIDSPGGEVTGTHELAQMIHAARDRKPTMAYIDGLGASAAYWLASAAEEVVCAPTALLGSIGVVSTFTDTKERDKQEGVRRIEIVSSQSPDKRMDPATQKGREKIQAVVDSLAAVFVADVAKFRGVSEETVTNDFGAGGVMAGADAVACGLADRMGSEEECIQALGERAQERARRRPLYGAAESADLNAHMGKETDMPTWGQIFGSLFSRAGVQLDAEATEATAADAAITAPPTPAAAAPVAGEPMKPSAETERLQAELAKERKSRLDGEAAAFAQGEIDAKRALPKEKDGLVASYLQAANDDLAHPVAEGQTSRVELLKAQQAARPEHQLTEELLKAQEDGASANGTRVVPSADPSKKDPLTAERRKQLHALSPLGQAVLQDEKR